MKGRAFLTEEQARAIHADRRSCAILAREHGVSPMTISHIKQGKTWKHLNLTPTKKHKPLETFEREQRSNDPATDGHDRDTYRGQATD